VSSEPAPARYRRRRRWPILVVLVLLLAGATVVWVQVLKPAPVESTGCNKPGPAPTTEAASTTAGASGSAGPASTTASTTGSTAGSVTGSTAASTTASSAQVTTSLGTFTDPNTLASIRPADPSNIPLRVLNASDVTGQAKTVTDELRDAGFTAIGQQANDPLYPAWDLRCYGEIRYGYAGLAEARTVLIVAPCAQLVLDDRADNSVDLSLGKLYQVDPVSTKVRTELTEIKNAAAPPPVIEGQTVSVRPTMSIPPLPSRAGCPG
jgi:hypothetical protein